MTAVLAFFGNSGSTTPNVLSITLNRRTLFGNSSTVPGSALTGLSVTATVSGGLPPYSGEWVRISGDSEVKNTAADNTTKFSRYFTASGDSDATFVYRVADSGSQLVDSETVSAYLQGGPNVP